MIREFVKGDVSFDGRNIGYRLFMANDYFKLKYNLSEEEVDKIVDLKHFVLHFNLRYFMLLLLLF